MSCCCVTRKNTAEASVPAPRATDDSAKENRQQQASGCCDVGQASNKPPTEPKLAARPNCAADCC